jgi:hypothetical protein
MQFGFFGMIPSNLRHCKDIKPNSKVLYSEIMACLEPDGTCIKRNAYFTKMLGIGKSTISNCLTELRNYGFIKVRMDFEKGTNKFLKRYITPTNFMGGVNRNIENTHTENLDGVDSNASLNGVNTYTNLEQTLLYNNNNIDKVYIDPTTRHTPIKKSINDKQKDALLKIVNRFYKTQMFKYPNMVKSESSDINGSINILYDLIMIDGFDYDSIKGTLEWAVEDKFWGSNLFSLKTLRTKSNNGLTKFQNLHHKYKSQ